MDTQDDVTELIHGRVDRELVAHWAEDFFTGGPEYARSRGAPRWFCDGLLDGFAEGLRNRGVAETAPKWWAYESAMRRLELRSAAG